MTEILSSLSLLLGGSWSSGVNLYLTTAVLGISHKAGWITLPGNLDTIANPFVIAIAILLYAVEFVADKVPFVDSAWDSFHTFIRPAGTMAMSYMATGDVSPAIQVPIAVLTGGIALDSHLTKATARAAINTSPEPVTNSIASVTEDVSVIGVMYLIIKHPVIASLVIICLIVFSIWFLKKMFKFLKGLFSKEKTENENKNQPEKAIQKEDKK